MRIWTIAGAAVGVLVAISGLAGAQDVKGEKIALWPGATPGAAVDDFKPTLTKFLLPGDEARGAVIVAPGGGYGGQAAHEGEPVARFFNEQGYHAFVLLYRVTPHRNPEPLMDAARAVRLVRANAADWKVKPDKIAVLGFSAGGHLMGSLAVFFDGGDAASDDPVARISSRPDAAVLCYPVISSGKFAHVGSFENLLGKESTPEQRETMSLEKHVRPDTPPTFLWSTSDDSGVPVENSLLFAMALREKGIPFEMHVFPHGPHGLGLAPKDPVVSQWAPLCAQWLKGMGW
jgi:acetyl esterase/lipase